MLFARQAGIRGLRASVRVSVRPRGKASYAFDGVLRVSKGGDIRLTGLAFMGYTVFDVVVKGEKFYFYRPSEGYLYTGPKTVLRGFLGRMGVDADPEVIYRSLFLPGPSGDGRYLVVDTAEGYAVYLVMDRGGALAPVMESDYDRGLGLLRRVFYDRLARPEVRMTPGGFTTADGFTLPTKLEVESSDEGWSMAVAFEKYIVNPKGLAEEFTIQGGRFKGIREVR